MDKDLTVGILVDFMAHGGMTPEEEMDFIEMEVKDFLPGFSINFEREVRPHDLKNKPIDMYVFDFGGLLPGCDGLLSSMYGELLTQIEDRPNVLFLIWSTISKIYLKDEILDRFDDEKVCPNVIYNLGYSERGQMIKGIREWFEGAKS